MEEDWMCRAGVRAPQDQQIRFLRIQSPPLPASIGPRATTVDFRPRVGNTHGSCKSRRQMMKPRGHRAAPPVSSSAPSSSETSTRATSLPNDSCAEPARRPNGGNVATATSPELMVSSTACVSVDPRDSLRGNITSRVAGPSVPGERGVQQRSTSIDGANRRSTQREPRRAQREPVS